VKKRLKGQRKWVVRFYQKIGEKNGIGGENPGNHFCKQAQETQTPFGGVNSLGWLGCVCRLPKDQAKKGGGGAKYGFFVTFEGGENEGTPQEAKEQKPKENPPASFPTKNPQKAS